MEEVKEKKHRDICPGCGSKMEHCETPEEGKWDECPNPNCDWFAD